MYDTYNLHFITISLVHSYVGKSMIHTFTPSSFFIEKKGEKKYLVTKVTVSVIFWLIPAKSPISDLATLSKINLYLQVAVLLLP